MPLNLHGITATLIGGSRDGKVVVTPGETIRGTYSIDKPSGVEKLWVEVVGIQYASVMRGKVEPISGKTSGLMSASLALNGPGGSHLIHTDKTFFLKSTELAVPTSKDDGKGEFEVVVPEEEDEFIDVLGKSWGRSPLPPSLYLGRRNFEAGVIGFNRYHVTLNMTKKNLLGRSTKSISLPFFLIPQDPNPSPKLEPIGTFLTPPDRVPEVPKGWVGRGEAEWDVKKRSWIKGLHVGEGKDKKEPREMVIAQISTPDIPSWPSGIPIPYHLSISYRPSDAQSSGPIDLTRLDPRFRLERAYKVAVGNDARFVAESIKGDGFVVNKAGVWVGEGRVVEMGEIVCKALPNVSNAGIRMQYDLELDVSLGSDLSFGAQTHTFKLYRPKITSNIRRAGSSEQLPAYTEVESWVGEEYWNGVEDVSKLKEK